MQTARVRFCLNLIASKLVGKNEYFAIKAEFSVNIGSEKSFNKNCRSSLLMPNTVILVVIMQALMIHSRKPRRHSSTPVHVEYAKQLLYLETGCESISNLYLTSELYKILFHILFLSALFFKILIS